MSFTVSVSILTCLAALACAVPGVYLTLSNRAMLIDAISHSLLPGIVIGYLLTHDFSSPLLFMLATLSALIVTIANTALARSGLLAEGASQGMIAPALLAVGVILVTAFARNLHLDGHTILVGDPNLVAFEEFCLGDSCFGPRQSWVLAGLLLINLIFAWFARRHLMAAVFDYNFALTRSLRPGLAISVLMLLTAITVTAAFAATGSILAITMAVAPAAIARLLTHTIKLLVLYALGVAVVIAQSGFWIAYYLNLPTSAAIAFTYGIAFFAALGWHLRKTRSSRARS
ncbi:metal ABC transporter permease [Canibacter zhoujuaniae]|uniref:metal ABC transporter permease n=1 Tax=Canibacter zhoujuaniae TaxID=2708343 RepID=UPI00141E8FA5|nr:metal ABC transporter permease [Canibacter zhoujuaniae]